VVVDLEGEGNGKLEVESDESAWFGVTGLTFLWNNFPRSAGPPDVLGRWDKSGVSTRPSALGTGVVAFNLSNSAWEWAGGPLSSWWVSLCPPLSNRNDRDLLNILAMAVSKALGSIKIRCVDTKERPEEEEEEESNQQ
jgi:hypothetical protein